jgi:DNA helicase-2/ATP-dependent DNA helicase PcrA
VTVSTIHAFANDVIRLFPEKFLSFRAMRPIDEVEQIALLEEILEAARYESLTSDHDRFFYLPAVRDRIGKLKQEAVTPQAFDASIDALEAEYAETLSEIDPKLKKFATEKSRQEKHLGKLRDLSDAYKKYLVLCFERGYYDFSDMIEFVGRALESDADLRATLAERYQFVMLDEFQDMSGSQNRIIDGILSAAERPNVMAVGDDDQSIYRFQGASLENLFHFSKRYADTRFIVLEENYRSTDVILRLAEKSIANNTERIGRYVPSIVKKLHANHSGIGSECTVTAYHNPLEEKAAVLTKIRKLIAEGSPASEVAILSRTNREASDWAYFLESNGVPAESKNAGNALENPFVTLALDLVEVVAFPGASEEKTVRLLRSGLFATSAVDVLRINRGLHKINYVRKDRMRILDLLCEEGVLSDLGVIDSAPFLELYSKIAEAAPKNEGLYEDFKRILDLADFVAFVEREGGFSDLESVFTLLSTVKEWSRTDPSSTIAGFLKKLGYFRKYSLNLPTERLSEVPGSVKCLTAHQSKGLEYGTVFFTGLSDGNWGGRRNVDQLRLPPGAVLKDGSESIAANPEEEERRLFFVAMTRAKTKLFLSYHEGEGNKEKIASVFLTELGTEPARNAETLDYAKIVAAESKPKFTLSKDLSKEEEAYIADFLSGYRLSPSDLSKFSEDPALFLRDTVFKYPFEDNEYTVFGKTYHRALELFYLEWKKTGSEAPVEKLVADFERALRAEVLSHESREKLLKKGREGLAGWYAAHVGTFGIPLELEYNFYPRNILFEGIPLTGKIDKIELVAPGSSGVRLVDYKTGRIKSLNEIKGLTANADGKYFKQLLFYKLLFELDTSMTPKYSPESLAIEFVEGKDGEYRSIEVDFSEEDFEALKAEIRDTWKKIHDPEFWRETLGRVGK